MIVNKMNGLFFKLIGFILLTSSIVTFSQITGGNDFVSGSEKTYSLLDCIEIALKNNINIKIAESRISSSEADVKSAFGQFLPAISVSSGYTRQLNAKPGWEFVGNTLVETDPKPNSYNLSANASLMIFDGFSRSNNYNRAYENYHATELNIKYEKEKIKLQIYQYYTDVIAKSQIVKIRKENLELGKKELERIIAQNQAGLIAIDFVYSQEADLGNKEYDLISAENNLNSSKANLMVLMGLKPDLKSEFLESGLPNEITREEITNFRNSIGSFNDLLKETFPKRFDYLINEAQIRAYEANLEGSHSGYYPRISASGGWSWGNIELNKFSDLGRSSIGFNMSIPIFDQFATNYRIQSAGVQLEQAKMDQIQLEQNIISNLQNALLNLEASEKQLEISERALKAANRNNESQQAKFKIGTSSVTDYLTANAQLITAQINRINAVYKYFTTQKEILFITGKLD